MLAIDRSLSDCRSRRGRPTCTHTVILRSRRPPPLTGRGWATRRQGSLIMRGSREATSSTTTQRGHLSPSTCLRRRRGGVAPVATDYVIVQFLSFQSKIRLEFSSSVCAQIHSIFTVEFVTVQLKLNCHTRDTMSYVQMSLFRYFFIQLSLFF